MKSNVWAFALVWLLATVALAQAPSGVRSALVIGNAEYGEFVLPGVAKSTDVVSQALRDQGYLVTTASNLGEKEIRETVAEFAAGVPTGGVAVVYYCGLGAHAQRFDKWYNLLRPVGVTIGSDNDYRGKALNVDEHLLKVLTEQGGSRVNLIFLDACWESPLLPEKGAIHGGMKEFETPDGAVVLLGAASGEVQPPQGDAASPFARALAQHLSKFDSSTKDAAEAISQATGTWHGGTTDAGIGTQPNLPMTEELREGNSPGEGFVNAAGMVFRWCPPGKFIMGSKETDDAATRDREPVEVTISQGFWMGQHEVTQREYNVIRRRNPPAGFTIHKNAPFWGASEAKSVDEFCKALNEYEKKAGRLPNGWEYAAPTEAQWEYACRAGSTGKYCFGDAESQLGEYGNFADKTLRDVNPNYYYAHTEATDGIADDLAPAGSYKPNAWGLRDMHGNVAELVADNWQPKLPGGKDPLVKVEKDGRWIIRGGAWCSKAMYCESSFRNKMAAGNKYNYVGMRVVLRKTK